MNVFDFAMRMEEESRAYYEQLAAAARSGEVKTLFRLLADSEREHYGHLAMLKAGTDPRTAQSAVLERLRNHVSEIVGGPTPAELLESDEDGYRHAIKAEEESIRTYEKLAEEETDPTVADLLRRLAGEERHHLEMVENIYDFVETPRTFLAWGEFSNLREY